MLSGSADGTDSSVELADMLSLRGRTTMAVILVVVLAVAAITPAVATASGDTSVTVTPENASLTTDETTTVTLIVGDVTNGVGAYNLTVSVDNATVAHITDYTLLGGPAGSDETISPDNSSLRVTAYGVDTAQTGSVSIMEVTIAGDAAGQTAVDVSVSVLGDEQGNQYSPVTVSATTLSVSAASAPTETSGSNSGGGGGGGSQSESQAEFDSIATNTGATIKLSDVTYGSELTATVPETAGAGVTISKIGFVFQFETPDFRVEATTPTPRPQDAPPLRSQQAIAYFRLDAYQMKPQSLDSATVEFHIDESQLPEGADPSEVTLYRYHNGQWRSLETNHLGDGTYQATTPGFSEFAVGVVQSQQTETTTPETAEPVTATEQVTTNEQTSTTSTSREEAATRTATETRLPGFTVSVSVLAFLLSSLVLLRRP